MIFRLTIDTDSDAFAADRNLETARILRAVATRLEEGEDFAFYETLFDVNGNDVGRAAFKA